jgi:hypothetical protein
MRTKPRIKNPQGRVLPGDELLLTIPDNEYLGAGTFRAVVESLESKLRCSGRLYYRCRIDLPNLEDSTQVDLTFHVVVLIPHGKDSHYQADRPWVCFNTSGPNAWLRCTYTHEPEQSRRLKYAEQFLQPQHDD